MSPKMQLWVNIHVSSTMYFELKIICQDFLIATSLIHMNACIITMLYDLYAYDNSSIWVAHHQVLCTSPYPYEDHHVSTIYTSSKNQPQIWIKYQLCNPKNHMRWKTHNHIIARYIIWPYKHHLQGLLTIMPTMHY